MKPVLWVVLVGVLVAGTSAQVRNACPSLSSNECYFKDAATNPSTISSVTKSFHIGGFFKIHTGGDLYTSCSKSSQMNKWGILNLQAFLYGVDWYGRKFLSSSYDVGGLAFDSCGRPEQNIENMLSYAQCKLHLEGLPQSNLVAYVGPYTNEDVMAVSSLATGLGVPILAPVANSPELSQGSDSLLKTLSPSFSVSIDATYALIKELKVPYILIIYDADDPLFMNAYKQLSDKLSMTTETCLSYSRAFSKDHLNSVVDDLEKHEKIRFVVPLLSKDQLEQLLTAVKNKASISTNSFRFIMQSNVGRDLAFMTGQSATVNNSLIVEPSLSADSIQEMTDFSNVLNDRSDGQIGSHDVAWIAEYYNTYPNDIPRIDETTPSWVKYSVAKTLESVAAIIRAMADIIQACPNDQVCNNDGDLWGKNLFDKISSKLNGASMPSSSKVYHYYVKSSNDGPVFDEITTATDLLDNAKYGLQFTDSSCPSVAECCVPPTTAAPTTVAGSEATDSIKTTDASKSKLVAAYYPRDQEITGAYFDADRESGDYGTRFDLDHKWIIALGVLAGLGVLSVVIFEIFILFKLLGTRMGNKWRTMWLGQLLLFGVLLCYLTLFAYLPIPTKATCGITRFGVGVSYSVCFAVLLVKLMVIFTSRSSNEVLLPGDAESPNYLKGIYQFLMFIFAVGVQVVINIQWLITVPPEAVPIISNNGERVWVCNHYTWEAGKDMSHMDGWVRSNFDNHVLSLIYIMVMILITTVLSLNAHGIITNHRESVFIGIASGFSIPIWLAWTLLGGLNDDHDYAQEFGDACIAFGLFLTATLILFAMFLPKVRQLVNMGLEGIYLEDDRDTYYAGSVIMAPPSYKGKGPNSVIYVNNQGQAIYSEPVVLGNGHDQGANHLRHQGSTYSAPPAFIKKADSTYGTRVLQVTDDLKGRHPQKPKTQSEIGYATNPRSARGTLTRSRSQSHLGAL